MFFNVKRGMSAVGSNSSATPGKDLSEMTFTAGLAEKNDPQLFAQ